MVQWHSIEGTRYTGGRYCFIQKLIKFIFLFTLDSTSNVVSRSQGLNCKIKSYDRNRFGYNTAKRQQLFQFGKHLSSLNGEVNILHWVVSL